MALFKKAQSEDNYIEFVEDILIKTPTNGSVVSKCMVVNGDIKSCEPIIIEGKVEGNIKCEDIVVVLSGGFVAGKIEAKEVRLDGQIEGPIEANIVEQLKDAKQEGYILANVAVLNGAVDGDIVCKESLEIGADAKIECYECKAEIITIEGDFTGVIEATKMLDVKAGAKVRGQIKTKELKSEIGSQILGSIKNFEKNNIIHKTLNSADKEPSKEQKELKQIS